MFLACSTSIPAADQPATIVFADASNTRVSLNVPRDDIRILAAPYNLTPKITDPQNMRLAMAVVDCHYSECIGTGIWLIRLWAVDSGHHLEFEVSSFDLLREIPEFKTA